MLGSRALRLTRHPVGGTCTATGRPLGLALVDGSGDLRPALPRTDLCPKWTHPVPVRTGAPVHIHSRQLGKVLCERSCCDLATFGLADVDAELARVEHRCVTLPSSRNSPRPSRW